MSLTLSHSHPLSLKGHPYSSRCRPSRTLRIVSVSRSLVQLLSLSLFLFLSHSTFFPIFLAPRLLLASSYSVTSLQFLQFLHSVSGTFFISVVHSIGGCFALSLVLVRYCCRCGSLTGSLARPGGGLCSLARSGGRSDGRSAGRSVGEHRAPRTRIPPNEHGANTGKRAAAATAATPHNRSRPSATNSFANTITHSLSLSLSLLFLFSTIFTIRFEIRFLFLCFHPFLLMLYLVCFLYLFVLHSFLAFSDFVLFDLVASLSPHRLCLDVAAFFKSQTIEIRQRAEAAAASIQEDAVFCGERLSGEVE